MLFCTRGHVDYLTAKSTGYRIRLDNAMLTIAVSTMGIDLMKSQSDALGVLRTGGL